MAKNISISFFKAAIIYLIGIGIFGAIQTVTAVQIFLASLGPYGSLVANAQTFINQMGWLTMLGMGITLYAVPRITGRPLRTERSANVTYIAMNVGLVGFLAFMSTASIAGGTLWSTGQEEAANNVVAPLLTISSIFSFLVLAAVLLFAYTFFRSIAD